jgi:hypothetical protein
MKNCILLVLLFAFTANSFCQQRNFTKEEYLEKSKRKQKTGYIWLGTGVALATTGIILLTTTKSGGSIIYDSGDLGKGLGGTLAAGVGAICLLTGAITLSKSKEYKRKAAMLSFKNEVTLQLLKNNLVSTYFPALSFSIRL